MRVVKALLQSFIVFSLLLSLFACTNNPLEGNKFKTLYIGTSSFDCELIEIIRKNFGSNKIKIIDNINSDKAVKLLLNGNLDAYIGTLEIPNLYKEEIDEAVFAKDAITIVVHPSNSISNLNRNQLIEIFSRQVDNWQTLNGSDKPIVVVDRANDNLNEIALYKNLFGSIMPISSTIVVENPAEVPSAISKFPNAISYLSFRHLNPSLKALSIDNIPASAQNINKGYYALSRSIAVYSMNSKLKANAKSESYLNFLKFLYSNKGQTLISKLSFMPLTEAELQLLKIEEDPVLIGVAAPLEDAYTDLGKSMVEAVTLAAEEINNTGGINSRYVEIITCNDRANVTNALECANKFAKAGVVGVIGHLTSPASIEASKIYVQRSIVQITPASTHPWVTERPEARGFVFRTIGRDDSQAKLIADLIKNLKMPHPLKVTVFSNSTLYGTTLASLVESAINKNATDKIVAVKTIKQGQNQYQNEVKSLDTQVLVFIGEYGGAAQLVKEMALAHKGDAVFIGADGIFSRRFIQDAGLRAEGAYVTGNTVDKDSPLVAEFIEKFKNKFKTEPSAFAMNSYDAMMILAHAIKAADSDEKLAINEAVKRTKYQGLTGLIYFNEMGDPVLPRMCIYQVQNGRFVRSE